jgi:hypothetical protein
MEVKLFEPEKEETKIDIEEKEKEESLKVLNIAANMLNGGIHDLMTSGLVAYIDMNDVSTMLKNMHKEIGHMEDNFVKEGMYLEDLRTDTINLGISCVCLFERIERDIKKIDEQKDELEDLEAAKPIFSMLKAEARKWEWGDDFDEFTISQYVREMVELGKKHNVELGIKENDVQEITTTYATELEVLEEDKDK